LKMHRLLHPEPRLMAPARLIACAVALACLATVGQASVAEGAQRERPPAQAAASVSATLEQCVAGRLKANVPRRSPVK